jgi:hypothetical protein
MFAGSRHLRGLAFAGSEHLQWIRVLNLVSRMHDGRPECILRDKKQHDLAGVAIPNDPRVTHVRGLEAALAGFQPPKRYLLTIEINPVHFDDNTGVREVLKKN